MELVESQEYLLVQSENWKRLGDTPGTLFPSVGDNVEGSKFCKMAIPFLCGLVWDGKMLFSQQIFIRFLPCPGGTSGKEPACQCWRHRRLGFNPREDPLEEGTTTHSSILAWRIPWTEESGRLPSMGCKDWNDWACTHPCPRHCCRLWGYSTEQDKISALIEHTFWWGERQ